MPFLIKLNKPEVQKSNDLFQNILLAIHRFYILHNPEVSWILKIQLIKDNLWEYNLIYVKLFFSPLCLVAAMLLVGEQFRNLQQLYCCSVENSDPCCKQSGNRQRPVRRDQSMGKINYKQVISRSVINFWKNFWAGKSVYYTSPLPFFLLPQLKSQALLSMLYCQCNKVFPIRDTGVSKSSSIYDRL